jgi:hypothetical protein
MNDVEERFSPKRGKPAWGRRQTAESSFFIEFGEARITTHGPLPVDENTSDRAPRLRRRRRAHVHADFRPHHAPIKFTTFTFLVSGTSA